jgi:hypothetical protein
MLTYALPLPLQVAEAAERDKVLALAAAREAAEQDLMEALRCLT